MSFSRMKPLPKMIIILGAVAAIVYGAKIGMQFLPKEQPKQEVEAIKVQVENVSTPVDVQPKASQPAPAPAPAEPAPALTPAAPQDAGVANVLKGR